MGRDCASERVPIALAEGRPENPRAKASAEIDVAAATVEGSPQTGPERPRAMGRRRALPPRDPHDDVAVALARPAHRAEPVHHGGLQPDQAAPARIDREGRMLASTLPPPLFLDLRAKAPGLGCHGSN